MNRIITIILICALIGVVNGATLTVTPYYDGRITEGTDAAWYVLRNDVGEASTDPLSAVQALTGSSTLASSTSGVYKSHTRGAYSYDASALPDDCTITAVTVKVWGDRKSNGLGTVDAGIIDFSPASKSDYVGGDYDATTFTRLASDIAYADFNVTNQAGINIFTFNAAGIATVSKTGNSSFMLAHSADIDNSSLTWSATATSYFYYIPLANATYLPEITITYSTATTPAASFTKSRPIVRIPQSVTMTDTSTNTPTGWEWSWGDGTANSTTQNPSHTYKRPGNYKITLTASNAAGQTEYSTRIWVVSGMVGPYALTLNDNTCFDQSSLSFSREVTEYERTMTIEKIQELC